MGKHGHLVGRKRTSEYMAWNNARNRCLNPKDPQFHRYGGRGISMAPCWAQSFAQFFEDVGPKPPGTSLDRIDNNDGYRPGNVRWATPTQQYFNRRNVRFDFTDYEAFRIMHAAGMSYRQIATIVGAGAATIRLGIIRLLKEYPDLPKFIPLDHVRG